MKEKNINGLLIEDDPDDTMLLMELMAQPGRSSFKFTFACAEDLKTGFEILAKGGIEVILLDLTLPDSRGLETVLKVRAQAPRIPIVVLTGTQDEQLGLEALRHGAQDYQVKGDINGHTLKRTISYAVERYRLLASIQNIIANTPDGMVIINSKGAIGYVNPAAAALLGGNAAGLLGKPFPFQLSESAVDEFLIPEAGGKAYAVETRVTKIEWNDEPARLVSMRDITELRRNERLQAEILEGRKTDKLKDEFMAVISHDMRGPLTILKGAAELLGEGDAGPLSKKHSDMVSIQKESILRLEKSVRHILDLSRLESGRAQISLQRVNAGELLRGIVRTFGLIADKRNIPIRLELEAGLPDVCADSESLIQVLDNLLDNALRFARTRISVRAAAAQPPDGAGITGAAPGYVQISVIDDGRGIPAGHIADLFNKFVQVSRISKGTDYHGTGLGLAICKESIERQNGRIWVESRPDADTLFHFLLPRYEPVESRH